MQMVWQDFSKTAHKKQFVLKKMAVRKVIKMWQELTGLDRDRMLMLEAED